MMHKRTFKTKKSTLVAIAVLAALIVLLLPRYESREDMYSKVPDVMKCSQDSDCVLTSAGACDPACPNVINKNFKTIWEKFPPSPQEKFRCEMSGFCVFRDRTFVAKCENGKCIPRFAPESPIPPQIP